MRFDVAGFSDRAGCSFNCDSLLWREKKESDGGVLAALCSAGDKRPESVRAVRLTALRILELAGEADGAEAAERTVKTALKETYAEMSGDAVLDAFTLTLAGDRAVWAGVGSAKLFLFSKGEIATVGSTVELLSGSVGFAAGDALMLCSDGFYKALNSLEMQIDLFKSADAARWLDYMLLRHVERLHMAGDSMSALLCIAHE